MNTISKKASEFNDFRFEGLNWKQCSNQYITMARVSDEKIVVKVADEHLMPTKYGYALILDCSHVVWLKNWQVSRNYFGNEVLLQKKFFKVTEWGDFEEFEDEPKNLTWDEWEKVARLQQELKDDDGEPANIVRWEI